jgi:hypothetical protein
MIEVLTTEGYEQTKEKLRDRPRVSWNNYTSLYLG